MDDQLASFVNSSSAPHHSPMISFDFNVMKQNLTSVQELYRTSAVTVAMFLNCLVILVVSNSRQLRYPRHVFWAAVSLFECLFLLECILELVVVNNHDELACRIFILLCPVDYSILLICLAMAAFDRYLAIARYEWYKETVTNRGVVATVSAASAVTFVVVTIPFWTDHQSIYTCTLNLSHVHWVYVLNFLLGIVCVLLHVKIFLASKSVIRQYLPSYPATSVTVTFVKDRSKIRPSLFSGPEGVESSPETAERVFITFPENATASKSDHLVRIDPGDSPDHQGTADGHSSGQCFLKEPGGQTKINRLEVRAALDMSVNVLPFWLCTFPVSSYAMALYWCVKLEGDCDAVFLTWTYMWDVFLLHSIYNPVMYMSTSTEFRRALSHIARKLINTFHIEVYEH